MGAAASLQLSEGSVSALTAMPEAAQKELMEKVASLGVATPGYDGLENGHDVIKGKIDAAADAWKALNATATTPTPNTGYPLALVADQDEASAGVEGYTSYLRYGKLVYTGANGSKSYTIDMPGEQPIRTGRGDKAGRGAEYSALEIFDGKMVTADDRTGAVDVIAPCGQGFNFRVSPLENDGGDVKLKLGDGKKDKPLKCEWSTQKDGLLYVGSTGKERTDDDGNVVHRGEMWIKTIAPGTLEVTDIDWTEMYNSIRTAAECPHGAGYMIHEGARWSDVHKKWFFLPRKMSRQPYDEVIDAGKCNNLMIACPDGSKEGSEVIMKPYLMKYNTRGCSDFLFVPGTNDCHIMMIRTEESLDNVVSTYASVIDLEANVLMDETLVASERKFEGAAWVGGFGPFPPPGPADEGLMAKMVKDIKLAEKETLQSAFVFIKPHACTDAVKELVKKKFGEVGIEILSEGPKTGAEIDKGMLIDNHYYAIACKATLKKPADIPIAPKKLAEFETIFNEFEPGVTWQKLLDEGRVLNALDACEKLGMDANTIDVEWGKAKKAKRIIKFGGGFYCAQLQPEGKEPLYTLNAFFMSMRAKFTDPSKQIHFFEVRFDAAKLAWADFRGKVLGPTDPATAPEDSLRGIINKDWQSLGLAEAPNVGDNGVHASASPFEGLAEKMNWLGQESATDSFAVAITESGVTSEMLQEWKTDPQVKLPAGGTASIFDQLEDCDFDVAVAKCGEIAAANK